MSFPRRETYPRAEKWPYDARRSTKFITTTSNALCVRCKRVHTLHAVIHAHRHSGRQRIHISPVGTIHRQIGVQLLLLLVRLLLLRLGRVCIREGIRGICWRLLLLLLSKRLFLVLLLVCAVVRSSILFSHALMVGTTIIYILLLPSNFLRKQRGKIRKSNELSSQVNPPIVQIYSPEQRPARSKWRLAHSMTHQQAQIQVAY